MVHLLRLLRDQRGANAIEYALVACMISVAAVAAFNGLGSNITSMYTNVSNKLG